VTVPAPAWGPLARRIAARTDILRVLDPATGRYTAVPWPDREPELPYAVHLFDPAGRTRLLALDVDAKNPSGPDAAAQTAEIEFLLTHAGIRHVTARSGPHGGRHVFIPFDEPLAPAAVRAFAAAFAARWGSVDISMLANTATGAIRPPGAPHRDGGRSALDVADAVAGAVFDTPNDMAALGELAAALDVDERVLRRSNLPLSPALYKMLRTGAGIGRYESMSEAVMALATSVLSRGHDPAWLTRQLSDPRNELSRRLIGHRRRDGSVRDVPAMIAAAVGTARRFVAEHPPIASGDDARAVLELISGAADRRRWAGRAALTDRAVLSAHLGVATRCGAVVYNVSQRQVAELASVHSRSTVEASHRRLVAAGWLRLVAAGSGVDSSTWRLSVPRPAGAGDELAEPVTAHLIGHRLFAWRQLGKAAARVCETLAAGPSSAVEIAQRTGLHPGTVRRSLRRLALLEVPVVAKSRSGWHLTGSADDLVATVDAAAGASGADRDHQRLIVRFDTERRLWRRWVDVHRHASRFRAMRPPGRLAA
jgi:hypothetical protein